MVHKYIWDSEYNNFLFHIYNNINNINVLIKIFEKIFNQLMDNNVKDIVHQNTQILIRFYITLSEYIRYELVLYRHDLNIVVCKIDKTDYNNIIRSRMETMRNLLVLYNDKIYPELFEKIILESI